MALQARHKRLCNSHIPLQDGAVPAGMVYVNSEVETKGRRKEAGADGRPPTRNSKHCCCFYAACHCAAVIGATSTHLLPLLRTCEDQHWVPTRALWPAIVRTRFCLDTSQICVLGVWVCAVLCVLRM